MSEPTAGTGPLTVLSAGAAALARADNLDQALGVIVEAGAAAVGAPMAAVFVQDGDDGALELLLTLGMADDGIATFAEEVTANPEHPIHRAALDRLGTLSRTGETPDGQTMTGADLPLVVAQRRRRGVCRRPDVRLAGRARGGHRPRRRCSSGSRTSRRRPSRRSGRHRSPPSARSGPSASRTRTR